MATAYCADPRLACGGSAINDVWMSGWLGYPARAGKLYHYDGTSWSDVTAAATVVAGGTLPLATTVFGTAADDVWVPLSDGRVLRYTTSGSASPTGTVTFEDNGAPLGGPVPLSGAEATITTAALSPGSHTIVANYS